MVVAGGLGEEPLGAGAGVVGVRLLTLLLGEGVTTGSALALAAILAVAAGRATGLAVLTGAGVATFGAAGGVATGLVTGSGLVAFLIAVAWELMRDCCTGASWI